MNKLIATLNYLPQLPLGSYPHTQHSNQKPPYLLRKLPDKSLYGPQEYIETMRQRGSMVTRRGNTRMTCLKLGK